jgi:hypothetical protein
MNLKRFEATRRTEAIGGANHSGLRSAASRRSLSRGRARRSLGLARVGWTVATVAIATASGVGALASAAAAAQPAPSVSTGGVRDVSYSTAILTGTINPRGADTDYYFQYGATSGYGAQTPLAPVGNGTGGMAVSQPLIGLNALSTYHYRLVAIGPGGTAHGADRKFATPRIPLALAIAGVPNPVTFGSPLNVVGTLSGTGNGNREVVLQAKPFPYIAEFANVGNPELTNATGGFSFPFLGLTQNAQVRVVSVGKPIVISPTIIESVAVSISAHVRHTRRHHYVRFYGSVRPAVVGAGVAFERLTPGGRYALVSGTSTKTGSSASSRFSRVVHIRRPGVYRVLVRVTNGSQVSNNSKTLLIK